MARITDDHNMGTSGAFSLNDLVDLQHKRTGNIYISETIFFDRVINPAAYSMGTDHNSAALQAAKILLTDHSHTFFFEI